MKHHNGRGIAARVVAVRDRFAFIAVSDPFAGKRHRYTLWKIRLGAGTSADVLRLGLEIPLAQCRELARKELV